MEIKVFESDPQERTIVLDKDISNLSLSVTLNVNGRSVSLDSRVVQKSNGTLAISIPDLSVGKYKYTISYLKNRIPTLLSYGYISVSSLSPLSATSAPIVSEPTISKAEILTMITLGL